MTRNNTNFPIRPLRKALGIAALIAPIIYLVMSATCFETPIEKFTAFILMTGIVELFFWFLFNFLGNWSKKNGY